MSLYIAKVYLAFQADDVGEACDAVSAYLTDTLMSTHDGLEQWSYVKENGRYPPPKRIPVPIDIVALHDNSECLDTLYSIGIDEGDQLP